MFDFDNSIPMKQLKIFKIFYENIYREVHTHTY